MNDKTLLELRNVRFEYGEGPTALPVLQGIDFAIHAQDRIALVGRSGSGKSTLMNILALKPTSVRFFGKAKILRRCLSRLVLRCDGKPLEWCTSFITCCRNFRPRKCHVAGDVGWHDSTGGPIARW